MNIVSFFGLWFIFPWYHPIRYGKHDVDNHSINMLTHLCSLNIIHDHSPESSFVGDKDSTKLLVADAGLCNFTAPTISGPKISLLGNIGAHKFPRLKISQRGIFAARNFHRPEFSPIRILPRVVLIFITVINDVSCVFSIKNKTGQLFNIFDNRDSLR